MRALLLFLFGIGFAASTAGAQERVLREDLFRRAFQSTSFILMMADTQEDFRKNLTPAEREAYAQIAFLSHMSNLRKWALSAGAHNFGKGDSDAFVFVMADGTEQGVLTETKARSEIVFSDDESLFRLKPGQPDRTAATSSDARDPIYINRRKIEKPDFQMSFAEVVGLAVHEYGNKVPAKIDKAAVDSLAAKIQEFVSLNTRVFETPKGFVSVTAFQPPRNHFNEYLQLSLTAPAGSPPGTLSKLWMVGDQGLAVFFNDGREVKDLTNLFTESVTRSSLRQTPKDSFDWLNLRWNLGSGARVTAMDGSSFKLEMTLDVQSALIPFANASSPDPRRDRPWARNAGNPSLKTSQTAEMQWTVDVSGAPRLRSSWRRRMTLRDPSVPVEKVKTEWRGRDFVLVYKMPATYQVPGFAGGEVPLRPYLQLRNGDQAFEIAGRPDGGGTGQFEFILKDAAARGPVDVVGLQLGPGEARSGEMIMAETLRVQVLLPQNERLNLPAPGADRPFSLKTVQLWNGERWISLRRSHEAVPRGSHLRFVFDSRTELSSMTLQQSYNMTVEMGLRTPGRPDVMLPGSPVSVNDRSLTVRADQLKQTRVGDKLIVDWQADRDFILNDHFEMDVDPRAAAQFLRERGVPINEVPPWARQLTDIRVQPPRNIGAIGAVNLDLQTLQMSPEQLFRFDRSEPATTPPELSLRPRGGVPACHAVFR